MLVASAANTTVLCTTLRALPTLAILWLFFGLLWYSAYIRILCLRSEELTDALMSEKDQEGNSATCQLVVYQRLEVDREDTDRLHYVLNDSLIAGGRLGAG